MAEFGRSTQLPHLEARRSCQQNSCYRPHSHDALSIGVIDAGTSVFASPLTDSVHLSRGDVVIIAADQVHQCNPDRGTWLYRMIHMDQTWATGLLPTHQSNALFSGVTVLRRPDLGQHINAWSELIFDDASPERIESGFRDLAQELTRAAPDHLVTRDTDRSPYDQLGSILDRLQSDDSNPSLDELAEMAGLTKFQLIRAVKQATGLAPLAWRQNARIVRARRMLREGTPISEAVHALGFADQSHFHRVFRSHVAASPGAYRA